MSCINISVQTTIDAPIQNSLLHGDVLMQTSTISHLNASIQASEPPPSLNQLTQSQKMSTACLNWAEETESLPITPLPPPLHQPHDLSVSRSPSSSSPFSTLQHHSKHFNHYSHQPCHCHSHSCFDFYSFYSPHHNSFKPAQSYFNTKTHSHLNWESDPWLSDLSHSLKALGWIRAP